MVGGGQPEFAPLLYKELIKRPENQSPEQRQALMRRLREALFKLIVIIGVCKPLEAIFDIDAITRPEDKDYSFSRYAVDLEKARRCTKLIRLREGWQCDEANAKRGFEWQNRLYQRDQGAIDDVLASQRDFGTCYEQLSCTHMSDLLTRLDKQTNHLRSVSL